MNEIIKEYTKAIGRENRKDIMVIGFIVLFFLLCLTFGIMLIKLNNTVINSRTALESDGTIRKITMIDARQAKEMEALHQARYFIENFYEYDRFNMKGRLNRALWIGDNSVKTLFQEFTKKGWYNNIIQANIKQYVELADKDLKIDYSEKPYKCSAKMVIVLRNSYSEESYFLKIAFTLTEGNINYPFNPHGLEVTNLEQGAFEKSDK